MRAISESFASVNKVEIEGEMNSFALVAGHDLTQLKQIRGSWLNDELNYFSQNLSRKSFDIERSWHKVTKI